MSPPWRVDRQRGTAGELMEASTALLAPVPSEVPERRVRLLDVTTVAVVLGSAQPDAHVDRARVGRAGVDVVRRGSGGGAVLVGPGLVSWVDVLLPRGDPLWDHDVGRAFWWLGQAWADALGGVGVRPAVVWRGPARRTSWSDRVCFAGVGPGEVTLAGRKVVGMCQRRTRQGALFQCALPIVWEPTALVDLLALGRDGRAAAAAELEPAARGLGSEVAAAAVAELVDRLP
jgi:lipoate-protein ligase A